MQIQPSPNYNKVDYRSDVIFNVVENQWLSATAPAMHYHDLIEIGIVKEGSGTFIINNEITHFNKGTVSVIFPGDVHISNSNPNDESRWTYILIDINRMVDENMLLMHSINHILHTDRLKSRLFRTQRSKKTIDCVLELYSELTERKNNYEEMAILLTTKLMIEIERLTYDNVQTQIQYKTGYSKILPAITYLSTHFSEEIRSKQLADLCFLSETHFRRIFKSCTGLSPLDYLYQLRISAAKSLLNSHTLSILEICYKVGYTSQTSFNKHFKYYTKMTPSEYLRKHR